MKLPKFEYASPTTVQEAVALLAASNGTAKPLAGGQSLVPILAFRLAAPSMLVDLGRIAGLDTIEIDDAGFTWAHGSAGAISRRMRVSRLRIRCLPRPSRMWRTTRSASAALSAAAWRMPTRPPKCPASRSPAMPNSRLSVRPAAGRSRRGILPRTAHHRVDARRTDHANPPAAWPSARRWGFQEFARRRGDFALAGVAAFYDLDSAGHATNTHIGVIGVDDRPRRLTAAEAVLNGRTVDANAITATAEMAAQIVDPPDDIHGTARYRRALLATLVERALTSASAKA